MKRIEDVTLLYEISKTLNEHLYLKKSLYKVLDTLSISINMIRGTITLLNPLTNEITIEVAHGISRTAVERVKYKLGEGITGKVIQTGHAVTIPKNSLAMSCNLSSLEGCRRTPNRSKGLEVAFSRLP